MTLEDDLRKKYADHKTAKVFCFKDETELKMALFLQLALDDTDEGLVFSDGDEGGKVVAGAFYFKADDLRELTKTTHSAHYMVQKEIKEEEKFKAHIIFYKPDHMKEILGEFVANDPHLVIASSGLYQEKSRFGRWQKKKYLVSNATVEKQALSTAFTMTIPGLRLTAAFECDKEKNKKLYKSAVLKVEGNVYLDTEWELDQQTKIVKWSPDVLGFYAVDEPENNLLRAAFFYASNQEQHLGNNDDGGKTEFKVTWTKE